MPCSPDQQAVLHLLSGNPLAIGTNPDTGTVTMRFAGTVPYFELACATGADVGRVGEAANAVFRTVLETVTGTAPFLGGTLTVKATGVRGTFSYGLPAGFDLRATIDTFCHRLVISNTAVAGEIPLINNALAFAGLPPITLAAAGPTVTPLSRDELVAVDLMAGDPINFLHRTAAAGSIKLTLQFDPTNGDLQFQVNVDPPPADHTTGYALTDQARQYMARFLNDIGLAPPMSDFMGIPTAPGSYRLPFSDVSPAAVAARRHAIENFFANRVTPNARTLNPAYLNAAMTRFTSPAAGAGAGAGAAAGAGAGAAAAGTGAGAAAAGAAAGTGAGAAAAAAGAGSVAPPAGYGLPITRPAGTATLETVNFLDTDTWNKIQAVVTAKPGWKNTASRDTATGDTLLEVDPGTGVAADKVVINQSKSTMRAFNETGYKAMVEILQPLIPSPSSTAAGTIGIKFSHDTNSQDELVKMAKAALDKGLAVEFEGKAPNPARGVPALDMVALKNKLHSIDVVPGATPKKSYRDLLEELDTKLLAPERTRLSI